MALEFVDTFAEGPVGAPSFSHLQAQQQALPFIQVSHIHLEPETC